LACCFWTAVKNYRSNTYWCAWIGWVASISAVKVLF
jgi:hypothetical protein